MTLPRVYTLATPLALPVTSQGPAGFSLVSGWGLARLPTNHVLIKGCHS